MKTYHGDKKYPCPEGIRLTRQDLIKMHFCGAQAVDCHSIRPPTIRDRHKFLFFWHSHASAPHMSRETEWKEVTSTEYLKFHTIRSSGATLQIFTYWEYLNFSLLKKPRKYLLWEIDMKMISSKGFEKFDSTNQLFYHKQSFLVVPSWKYWLLSYPACWRVKSKQSADNGMPNGGIYKTPTNRDFN